MVKASTIKTLSFNKGRNTVTILFIALMIINIVAAISMVSEGRASVFSVYLKLYGVHLSIILLFYFSGKSIVDHRMPVFVFVLTVLLLVLWNGAIMAVTSFSLLDIDIGSNDEVVELDASLSSFHDYGNILIAGAIVWLFNSGNEDSTQINE